MAKKNITFVDSFEEEVRVKVDLHKKAIEDYRNMITMQMELMTLEQKKTEAASSKLYSKYAELQSQAEDIRANLRGIENAAAESRKDILAPEDVEKMQAAFFEELDKADEEDLEKMLPLIEELRKIARVIEDRNTRGFQAVRDLNLCIGNCYVPPRDNDIAKGVRSLIASKTYRRKTGEDINITSPAFVEL